MQRKYEMQRKQAPGSPTGGQSFALTLGVSLVLFVIITVLALRQSPRPYPLAAPTGWQSFALPREQNAFLRLPLFSGTINDLFVVPDSSLVWAVGDNGLVLHSADGGISWQRQQLWQQTTANNGVREPAETAPGKASTVADIGTGSGVAAHWTAAPPTAATPSLFARANAAVEAEVKKSPPLPPSNLRFSGTKDVPPDTDAERQYLLEQEQQQQNQLPQQNQQPQQQRQLKEPLQQQVEQPQQQEESPRQQEESPRQQEEPPTQQEEPPSQEEEPPTQQEEPPTPSPQQPLPDLRSVWFFDANIGVVAGDRGALYRTEDGGDNWQVIRVPSSWDINHLFAAADGRLYGALDAAVIYSTDRGANWTGGRVTRRIVETPVGWLERSESRSSQTLVIGRGGSLYQVSDEGDIEPLGYSEKLPHAIRHGVGRADYWLGVGDQGAVVRGTIGGTARGTAAAGLNVDGGIRSPTDQTLRKVLWVNDKRALAVGEQGAVIESVDVGQSWSSLESATDQTLVALAAINDQVLLAAGTAGTLLRSNDGGSSWNYVVASAAVLASEYVKRHPGQQLRRNGEQFEVAAAGRDNWQALTYQRTPALWYWLAGGYFVLLALGIANRKRELRESTVETVADVLASDRPLRPGDPDPLQFGAIARGLSRFMRNPKTEPPLTVAITGAWGTGKSSLMNLLHHDLKTYGFTPVWFNAWHHQKGEQLLASLYANIRSQAVPGWFSWSRGVPVGLLFRLNLLFRRSRKNLLVTLLLILVFTAATVYLQLDSQADYRGWIGEKIVQMASAGDLDSLLVVLFGNLAPLLAALRALRAFGLNPENLMAVASGDRKAGNGMDPGARQRFAREFDDVSSSLELGRMVIFIDDLDRCRQENVVDILEAVNFLAVSGDCYIVIGMDEKWVRVCIEQQFAQMVEAGQSGHTFSENYLEKLINIKVPVPTLEADASSLLLTPGEPPAVESVPLQRLRQWGLLQWQRYRYLLWMLGIAAVGVVAGQLFYLLGERLGPDWLQQSEPEPEPIAVQQWDNVTLQPLQLEGGEQGFVLDFKHVGLTERAGRADQSAIDLNKGPQSSTLQLRLEARPGDLERGVRLGRIGNGGAGLELVLRNTPVPGPAGAAEEKAGSQPGEKKAVVLKLQQFAAGQPSRNSVAAYALATAILLALAGAILYYLLKRQTRIVSDSAEFREALNLWHPWIMLNRQTPRAIKRYLNRVRYIAMRYRSEDTATVVPLWRRLFTPQAVVAEPVTMNEDFLDEAQLVALSAIFSVDETWLGDAEKFDLLAKGNLATLLAKSAGSLRLGIDSDSSASQALVKQLQSALQQHLDKYGDAFLEQDARRKFLKVVTATEFA